ncbi:MAG: helix-turn-helix domain-containing protein [Acidobacteria bacterium]|nr:helix-turn-helix domain-containing protein [Acidobacteriota bacterium]
MDELLKAQDVARAFNLKVSTVYALAHDRVIPHVVIRQGRRRALIRFRKEEIEELIRERTVPATHGQE